MLQKSLLSAVIAFAAFALLAGCHNKGGDDAKPMTPEMHAQDQCPICYGVQTLRDDGRCPKCGTMMRPPKTTTRPAMSADACSHCAGVQTATADGKCPLCGMKVVAK